MGDPDSNAAFRRIPGVDSVLERPAVRAILETTPRWAVVDAVRRALDDARAALRSGTGPGDADSVLEGLDEHIAAFARARLRPSLTPVVNATGVVLHTNLGRAPLAPSAIAAIEAVARGWSNVEYDLEAGSRGNRHGHLAGLLRDLTGAEAAVVVNNNASAVMLALAALAEGREVLVSRGELVEIGGSFRIPDVCRQSGARLVEVGATNRTHAKDYRAALTPDSGALLKVHRSNFAMRGFVAEVDPAEMCAIGAESSLPVLWDLGSGCLVDLAAIGLGGEPTVRQAVATGCDLITFSGDKLLGGPQAGIICGSASLVDRVRRHPLMRAVRPGKTSLAALEATLRLYRDGDPLRDVPVLAMLAAQRDELSERARTLAAKISAAAPDLAPEVVETVGRVGGGAMPEATLPSAGVRLTPHGPGGADALGAALHRGRPPVVARVDAGGVILDLRTLSDADFEAVVAACAAAGP